MTSLRNFITPEEYKVLNDYRETHLPADSTSTFIDSHDLLTEWESAKSNLFHLLGDQLTYSFPIQANSLGNRIDELLNTHQFVKDFDNWLREFCRSSHTTTYPISQLLNKEHLLENNLKNLITNKQTITKPDGHKISFDRNSHPLRILKKISRAFGFDKHFEDFRNECSKITQFQKIYTCTLSIHPMDYLTLSNNVNGWTSCLRLDASEPGCYSAGVSNILNSPYLLVAYIASDSKTYCNWNSKIWRETFIIQPGLIMGIKGYPNWDHSIETQVLNQLRILAEANLGEHFPPVLDSYDGDSKRFISKKENMFTFLFDNAYDDLVYTHNCYLNYNHFITNNLFDNEYNDFEVAGASQCLWCGELYPDFDGTASPVCYNCDNRPECILCGERHSVEDIFNLEGVILCESCYYSLAQWDSYNGEYYLPQNTSLVFFPTDRRCYVRTTDIPSLWLEPVEPITTGFRRGVTEDGTSSYQEQKYELHIDNLSEKGRELYDYIRY